MIEPHWIHVHPGQFDNDAFAKWKPAFPKVIGVDWRAPGLQRLSATAKIIYRNHPMSEMLTAQPIGLSDLSRASVEKMMATGELLSTLGVDSNDPASYWEKIPFRNSWSTIHAAPTIRGLASGRGFADKDDAKRTGLLHAHICAASADYIESTYHRLRNTIWFELLNEPHEWSDEPPELLTDYTVAALEEGAKYNLQFVVGNLGVGWPGNHGVKDALPDYNQYKDIFSAIRGTRHYWGQHEYWDLAGSGQNWGWWAGRCLRNPYNVRIVITECGIDRGVVQQRGGWHVLSAQNLETKAARYAGELVEYWNRLAQDGRVEAIYPFTWDGQEADWWSYDLRSQTWLDAFLAVQNQQLPVSSVPLSPPSSLGDELQKQFGQKYHDIRANLLANGTFTQRPLNAITRLILHHTATIATYSWIDIAKYHVLAVEKGGRGWPGISYHLGINQRGEVALLGDPETIRYHAGEANTDSLAIACMGNFEEITPTAEMIATLRRLHTVLCDWLGRSLPLIPHNAVGQTACPGQYLLSAMAEGQTSFTVEERIRNAAWNASGIAYNPEAALAKYAQKQHLGRPMTNEFDFEGHRIQGFGQAIVYARIPANGQPWEPTMLDW